jgi:Sec-independent protein secretion pathway component TatC
MVVAPSEVFPLLGSFHSREFTILAVLLAEIDAVSMILMVIPRVIIFALPIIISPVLSPQRYRRNQNGAQQ